MDTHTVASGDGGRWGGERLEAVALAHHGRDALVSLFAFLQRFQEVLQDFVVSGQLKAKQLSLVPAVMYSDTRILPRGNTQTKQV